MPVVIMHEIIYFTFLKSMLF